MMKTIAVNMYKVDGEWCYAMWIDGEYDTSEGLGVRETDGWDDAVVALRVELAKGKIALPAEVEWRATRPSSTSGQGGEMRAEWEQS